MQSNDQSIIVKPKKWFRISNYIASVCGLFLFVYIINQALFQQSGDLFFLLFLLIGVSAVGIVASLFIIFTQHRHQIIISEDRIAKHGFIHKEILFDEMQKVVVRNGGIEIHGEGLFETISFGDLHQNYHQARNFLSRKLSQDFKVDIQGKDEFVEQFLGSDS